LDFNQLNINQKYKVIMEKKKYIKMIMMGLSCLTLSCSDFLDEKVIDQVSVDYLYTTPGGLEVGVNALYNLQRRNNVPEQEGDPLKVNVFFMVADDLGHTRTWHEPYGPGHTAAGFPALKWTVPYQIIDRANALISAARNIDMDEEKKNKLVAQARVIRGELYLDLLQMFDNILLDTIATTPQNAFDKVEYKPADPADVYKLIDSDLDFAIAHLDWVVPYGRYGQGVARHIRGKSALWQSDWAEAAAQFDAIVENGTHHLVDVKQVFGQDLKHAEALFVYTRNMALGASTNGDILAGGGGAWMSSVFNNRLYELSTGEMIATVDNGGQSLGWSYPNDYLKSLYDQTKDLRFETYYYPLKLYVNNPAKPNYGEPLPASSYDDNYRRYHWSLKKFHDELKSITADNSWKDILFYRFAETLLLGAEAHWHLSGEDPNDAKALEYINKIRTRAGLGDEPFTAFTLDNYLVESARELAFERNRWFLLKRLGVLVERQNLHYTYGSNSTNTVLEPMAPYMVRLPIPQSQIDLMGTFPQNEGY
jgi:hypothetical protein